MPNLKLFARNSMRRPFAAIAIGAAFCVHYGSFSGFWLWYNPKRMHKMKEKKWKTGNAV